ncbi:EF-hand domain-containing protein [Pseudomonas sp. NPDC089422]|uniref:EF-hand domain-containing protein n=1 Tax=Pseudomonas sp. NPDC089422 TaxID=3364466 RepID=UPI0037FE3169
MKGLNFWPPPIGQIEQLPHPVRGKHVKQREQDLCDKARETLLELDRNGDRKVSIEEFKLAWLDVYSEEEFDKAIKEVNLDNDGFISVKEFFIRLDGTAPCD